MRVRLAEEGAPVVVPTAYGVVVLADFLVAVAAFVVGVVLAVRGLPASHPWAGYALCAWAAAAVHADRLAARMAPSGLTLRRRLGYALLLALAWRGGPLEGFPPAAIAAVVGYVGVVWVALLVGGRALSRAVADATGEDQPA